MDVRAARSGAVVYQHSSGYSRFNDARAADWISIPIAGVRRLPCSAALRPYTVLLREFLEGEHRYSFVFRMAASFFFRCDLHSSLGKSSCALIIYFRRSSGDRRGLRARGGSGGSNGLRCR